MLPGLPAKRAPVDRDGFALVDILIDDGRIAEIAPAGRGEVGEAPRLALAGGIVLPLFVDAHTHLDKAPYLAARAQSDGDFVGALATVASGSRRQLERARRRAADGVLPALRLRARHRSDPHPYRQRRAADGDQLAGVRRGARALARPDRAAGDAAVPHRLRARRGAYARRRGDGRRARLEHSRRGDLHGPAACRGPRRPVPLAERKGWDLDFHVDETADPAAALARRRSPRPRSTTRFAGRILAGHCCSLARQERGRAESARSSWSRAPASASCRCRCATCSCRIGSAGRTPRWRGVTALHELKAAGRQRDDRQRQYARSVLRLRRSRHAGGLARGRAHPPSRLSRSAPGRRRCSRAPAQGDGARGRRHSRRRARRPDPDARARFHRACSRVRTWTGRCCAHGAPLDAASAGLCRNRRLWRASSMGRPTTSRRSASAIGAIECEDNPVLVRQKSRDFYWYSPVLKRELEAVTADIVVSPKSRGRGRHRARRGLCAEDSGHAARRRHRQLRPGDAADRRRAAQPDRR